MPTNANSNINYEDNHQIQQQQEASPVFHDFLGMKVSDSHVGFAPSSANGRLPLSDASPTASAPLPASSAAGRGLLSASSDLGSERPVSNHLEGVPFYSPRFDSSGPDIGNRLVGSKRSNSDSAFMGSYRERIPHMSLEILENSHLVKTLRNGSSRERSRKSNDDEVLFGLQPLRPNSGSLIFPASAGNRTDPNSSKWEKSLPMNYPPRGAVPFMHQVSSNRFRDTNAGPSTISHSAADEGSRTGIKGHGLLSSINAASVASERNSSGCNIKKSGMNILDPEVTIPQSGGMSTSRQMTIFYGGQAHVFDDVHPNKADVIMALAGSNGGSWSTSFSPKSNARPVSETNMARGAIETGATSISGMAFVKEHGSKLGVAGNNGTGVDPLDQISNRSGSTGSKEAKNPVEATHTEGSMEKERRCNLK